MKKIVIIFILLLICLVLNAQSKKVAVYVTGGATEAYNRVLGSKIAPIINKLKEYSATNRTVIFLWELTKMPEYNQEETSKLLLKLGRRYWVDYIYIVKLTIREGTTTIELSLLNVDSGYTALQDKIYCPSSASVQEAFMLIQPLIKSMFDPKKRKILNKNTDGLDLQLEVKNIEFDMTFVQGGSFSMGCTSEQGTDCDMDERPSHRVTLSDYYIGKYEVTQNLWEAVMEKNHSYSKGDELPVENVSWLDCMEFIRRLNVLTRKKFRLPTEAEWEYAARGGRKSNGYKYAGSNNIKEVAWFWDNSTKVTRKVGSGKPNELGIYDMSGNVYEWCSDWAALYSSKSQINPKGPIVGTERILRGGSWYSPEENCRISLRFSNIPSNTYRNSGFRLALSK
ncbi:MAG: formylglycine-generating enzyme family protein [Bacteroidales bacterium]